MNKSDLKSDLPFLYKTGIAELFTRSNYSKTVNFQKEKINYLIRNIRRVPRRARSTPETARIGLKSRRGLVHVSEYKLLLLY